MQRGDWERGEINARRVNQGRASSLCFWDSSGRLCLLLGSPAGQDQHLGSSCSSVSTEPERADRKFFLHSLSPRGCPSPAPLPEGDLQAQPSSCPSSASLVPSQSPKHPSAAQLGHPEGQKCCFSCLGQHPESFKVWQGCIKQSRKHFLSTPCWLLPPILTLLCLCHSGMDKHPQISLCWLL